MAPIVLTQAQLQSVATLVGGIENADRPTRFVRFRSADMVVTNGHVLLRVPLPSTAGRDFAVDGAALGAWTSGLPAEAEIELEPVGGELKLACLNPNKKAGRFRGQVLIPLAGPVAQVVGDSGIDAVLTQFKEGAPVALFALSHRYLDKAREFIEAFSSYPSADEYGVPLKLRHADSPRDPIHFQFDSAHGQADLIVMPMRAD